MAFKKMQQDKQITTGCPGFLIQPLMVEDVQYLMLLPENDCK